LANINRLARKLVPSTAYLSYNPIFRLIGDNISRISDLFFPELKNLPPNHLRVRIGVGSRLFFNQFFFLEMGTHFWLKWLSSGYVKANSEVVEIGCGCGRIAHPLREDWFKGTYVGIDIDTELLDWCSSHFPSDKFSFMSSPHTSATYSGHAVSENTSFAFPNSWRKDFVYSTSLYTHLLEPELINYTRESYKILRDGGTMCMSLFCLDSVEKGGRWTFQHKIGEAYVENLKYPEAAVAYTKQYITNLCHSVGFRDVVIYETSGQSLLVCQK
jgi:SAM-dependent methyltransferase